MENNTPNNAPEELTPPPSQEGRLKRFVDFAGGLVSRHYVGSEDHGSPVIEEDLPQVTSNYETEMSAWTERIKREAEATRVALGTNSFNAKHSWSLHKKVYSAEKDGHQWLDDGRLVKKGIDRRYGSMESQRQKEDHLYNILQHRRAQLDYARNFNSILEFVDELDPKMYGQYIAKPNQLGSAFNLPPTKSPTKDPEEASRLLNGLPFVSYKKDVIEKDPREHPRLVIKGNFNFPTERIIGVETFNSWAGRGEPFKQFGTTLYEANGKGDKAFSPRNLPGVERTSRGAITDYAQTDLDSVKETGGNASLLIVRDADGEYWGIATTDGSHRVAAAKLRGEATTIVNEIEIASDEDMPRLDYSVKEQALGTNRVA